MGIFSKWFRKDLHDRRLRGDRHFDAGELGLARSEYEAGLAVFDERQDDPGERDHVAARLLEVRDRLGQRYVAEGREAAAGGRRQDAEDALRFAVELLAGRPGQAEAEAALADAMARREAPEVVLEGPGEDFDLAPADDEEDGGDTDDEGAETADAFEQYILSLPPPRARAYRSLGPAFAAGYVALHDGEGEAAVSHLREALAERSDSPLVHFELGRALLFVGDGAGAAEHLQVQREAAPEEPETAWLLAEALRLGERPDEARAVLQTEVERRPGSARAWLELAQHHLATGTPDAAEEAVTTALERVEQPDKGMGGRATSWTRSGSSEGAVRAAAQRVGAEERVPPRITLYKTLGLARVAAGRPQDAIAPLEKALKEHWRYLPEEGVIEFDREAAWIVAGIYVERGERLDRAIELLHALAGSAPPDDRWLPLARLGRALEKKGRDGEALEAYRRARAVAQAAPAEERARLDERIADLSR
jgi:tetratricopeptide (TPR) repeat protein